MWARQEPTSDPRDHSEYPTAVVARPLHSVPPVRRVVRRSYDRGARRRRRATRPSAAAATDRSAGSHRRTSAVQPTTTFDRRHAAVHVAPMPRSAGSLQPSSQPRCMLAYLCCVPSSAPYAPAANASATPSLATNATTPAAGAPAQPPVIAGPPAHPAIPPTIAPSLPHHA